MAVREHEGRVALVTGASRGIGRAIALRLGECGARVICVSRSEASSAQTVSEIVAAGGLADAIAVDVADMAAVGSACADVLRSQGVVDILVNCAGITRDNLLMRMGDDEWNDVLQTDLSSCFSWTRGLCAAMMRKRWGRIVNVASVIALVGNAGQANYSAAKAGVIAFTKSVARELATRGITANAVAPGFIETDMTAKLRESIREKILTQIPVNSFGSVDDVAAAVEFLASDRAKYITGATLRVDGGMAMC
jgi:3-oxoacyl-[acyl-carrier protein] reductase